MTMRDVIVGLRQVNPAAQDKYGKVSEAAAIVKDFVRDLDRVSSEAARKALTVQLDLFATEAQARVYALGEEMARLEALVASYTRRLEEIRESEAEDGQTNFDAELNEPTEGDMEEVSNG